MAQITPWLYIGNYRISQDIDWLEQHNIQAILHLADNVRHPNITTLYLPVEDGMPLESRYFQRGMQFIAEQRAANHPILVACGAGISRSATFCMAALKEQEGMSLMEAYKLIKAKRDVIQPHLELLKSLCRYYQAEAEFEPLWRLVAFADSPAT